MPMKFIISGAYGEVSEVRNNVPHNGIDIPMEIGTKLRSIYDGVVERIIENSYIGKGVVIRSKEGFRYTFGHLQEVTVKKGQAIQAGKDIIGLSGNSGNSSGPHLHFTVQLPDGSYVDPSPALQYLEQVSGADPFNQFVGSQPLPGSLMDWINGIGDKIIGKEKKVVEAVSNPIASWFKGQLVDLGHWLVANTPEIMGYGALLTAVLIILGSMIGKGGMIKPLAAYVALLILALCLLSGQIPQAMPIGGILK